MGKACDSHTMVIDYLLMWYTLCKPTTKSECNHICSKLYKPFSKGITISTGTFSNKPNQHPSWYNMKKTTMILI